MYGLLYDTVLRRIPPERAHLMAVGGLRAATALPAVRDQLRKHTFPPELSVEALGRSFPSPLGVAAGLDKNAEWFDALGAIGFGFVEVGTVTPRAQQGNPAPRLARILSERALVNRLGFPNSGARAVRARLARRTSPVVLGANLGKNRDTPLEQAAQDYRAAARVLAPVADYVVINVSSPNTPGLRALESTEALRPLIDAVSIELRADQPLLVKISPDLADDDLDAVATLAMQSGLAGVIATNTTVDRNLLSARGAQEIAGFEGGGLSGPPLKARSLAVLRRLHQTLAGSGLVVISVGGVSGADDVWERVLAGASLVQAYTGFVYGGPGWPAKVNRELAKRVRAAGVSSIGELIGSAP